MAKSVKIKNEWYIPNYAKEFFPRGDFRMFSVFVGIKNGEVELREIAIRIGTPKKTILEILKRSRRKDF